MPNMTITIENIDLQPEIEEWENAYCGKDVRQANIDAFEKIQESVNGAIQGVVQVANNQQTVVDNAQQSVAQANSTLQAAQQAQQSAAQDASEAAESASEALTAKNDAETAAAKAEQYSNIVAPDFYLDVDTGILYQKAGVGVEFYLDEDTGILYWKITNATDTAA